MGLCIDTVLGAYTNAATTAAGLSTVTPPDGDSLTVRDFPSTQWAKMESMFLQGSGTRQARIKSARFHDNVTGITIQSSESPTEFPFPQEVGQRLYSSDKLSVQVDAAASSSTVIALLNYYKDIDGINANLVSWADIVAKYTNLKIAEVACTSSATIGDWSDTVITTTEDQWKADHKYALLGFMVNTAVAVVALKGPCSGNLRIGCPGASGTLDITRYFAEMGARHNVPHIPVFKANDRNNTYVSVAANTASVAVNVYMVTVDLGE